MNSAQLEKEQRLPSSPALDGLHTYLTEQVTLVAQQLDREAQALFEAFEMLGSLGLLTPKAPTTRGGMGFDTQAYWQFQSLVARYSGALAFLQTQHQSAASFLLASENKALQTDYLPAMALGERRVGVGFSQLRRHPCPLQAQAVEGGYRLSGEVPWVSGAGLFDAFIGAAVLPSGEAVFGLLPLENAVGKAGRLEVSEPMALVAMPSTCTVRVRLEDWFLASSEVVGVRPVGWLERRDHANPLSPLGMMLGCAQAGIDSTRQSLLRRQIASEAALRLSAQLNELWLELPKALLLPTSAYAQKMALRGRAIALMNTCAQAAVIAASGAANTEAHPAQRIYREALVFSVSGQTAGGAIASLEALTLYEGQTF